MFSSTSIAKQHVENPLRHVIQQVANNNKNNKNNVSSIIIDKQDTNIPINLPTAIIGDKGSGKTTLIKALINSTANSVFNHIYLIYSALSFDEDFPEYVVKIDVNNCDNFLSSFFEIKSIFNSYVSFFKRARFLLKNDSDIELGKFLSYCDNNIIKYNQDIINKVDDKHIIIDKIISTGEKIVRKFSKEFYIDNIKINGLKIDDRDAILIDDIAIASKVLFTRMRDNNIYTYMTLTRHMRLFIAFAGQQIEQIPKTLRREIQCWIISKNTNLELLKGILQKSTLKNIESKQVELDKYQFVLYNAATGYLGTI